jgi:hypothetical protein
MRRAVGLTSLLLAAFPVVALSDAAPGSPEQIVEHHLSAAAAGDVDGVVGDYADNAVLITPAGQTKGKEAIRKAFAGLFAPGQAPRPKLEVQRKYFTPEIGYILWVQNPGKPEEVRGSDTFVVRKGKIIAQTVAVVPLHPPAG